MSKKSRRERAKSRYANQQRRSGQPEVPLSAGLTERMQANLASRGLSAAQADLARVERQSNGNGTTAAPPRRTHAPEIQNRGAMASAGQGVPGSDGWNEQRRPDPARNMPNMPPNLGRQMLPNVLTFQGIVASISKAYMNWDQAVADSADNALRMRNDTQVMECIKARQRCVSLLNWHLELDGPAMPAHEALRARMTRIMKRIPHFLKYRQSLLEAIWFGKSANQHRFGWHVKNGQNDIVINKWMPVNGDKIVFRMDDGKNQYPDHQIGFKVGMQFNQGDIVEGRKMEATMAGLATFLAPYERNMVCLHQHEIEDAAYEMPLFAGSINGVGIRSQIYWTWFQKIEFQALLMEFMERAALGFEIWYYPEGNEQAVMKLQQDARNRVGRRNFLLFPVPLGQTMNESPYDVKVVEANMAGAESLRSILDGFFGHQIKRYILGQILTSEVDATGLGSSLADIHYQTLLDIVKYDATGLEESITKDTLYPLGRLNDRHFDDVDMRFVIETQSPDVMEKLDAYQKAWEMGARLKESDVLETIAASIPGPEDTVLQNPQAMPQQAATGMPGMEGQPPDATSASNAELPPGNFQQAFDSPEERDQDLQTQVAGALGGQDATTQPPSGPAQYRHPNMVTRMQYHIDQKRRRQPAVTR